MPKVGHFFEIQKNKKLSPGKASKKTCAKFGPNRTIGNVQNPLSKWRLRRLRLRRLRLLDENFGHFAKTITLEPRRILGRGKRLQGRTADI